MSNQAKQEYKDVFGNALSVGDEVVFMQIGYRCFKKGFIKSLADKSALIQHERFNVGGTETRQRYDQIFKVGRPDQEVATVNELSDLIYKQSDRHEIVEFRLPSKKPGFYNVMTLKDINRISEAIHQFLIERTRK